MNKIISLLAGVACMALSCTAQNTNVPAAVKNAFGLKFPDAKNVRWSKENKKEYEAEFDLNNRKVSANFSIDGSWAGTESALDIPVLPEKIKQAIALKYPGANIESAEMTEQAGKQPLYEVIIRINRKKKEVVLSEEGNILN